MHSKTKGRRGGTTWHPAGGLNPNAILNETKVRSIRAELMNGVSRRGLAEAHGVTPRTIRSIAEGTRWRGL